jgi:hypothetical protein
MVTMKIYKLLLSALIVFSVTAKNVHAQKSVNEAVLNYTISTESTNDKAAMAKALEGATLTVYIKGTHSRTDMTSTLGTESNFYDSKSGSGTILKQYSGQKLMITLNSNNWAQKNKNFQNLKFSIDNNELSIAGYTCKKATARSADGTEIIVYYYPNVVLLNKQYDNAFPQLAGIPVQYELQSGALKFKYTLSNISYDPVPSSKFEIPKTGYRIMSYEETQQLKKSDK